MNADRAPEPGGDTLRSVTPDDLPAVAELVVAAGLFTRDDVGFIEHLADGEGTTWLVQDAGDGAGLAGMVLYRPEEAADRVFDLTMLASDRTCRAAGGVLR